MAGDLRNNYFLPAKKKAEQIGETHQIAIFLLLLLLISIIIIIKL